MRVPSLSNMRMNSRQRVLAAINHQPVDRIPTDIWATPEVWQKLHARFGEGVDLREALHLDGFGYVDPKYTGPTLPPTPEGETVDMWGLRHRAVDYGTGVYWEQVHYPLASARTIDDLERYRWPSADWFDYSEMKVRARPQHDTHAVKCGYMAIFYYHNLLRGLAQSLMDPHDDAEFTHHLLNRVSDFFYDHHRRMFEACEGLIDVCEVTDDLGSQTGPLIGLDTFREFYKPQMLRFAQLCRDFGVKVFHHDDGAMRAFLPDLLEVGIDILNPVQHVCPGMEMVALKRDYGDRLCFHGGIDNQQLLPFGTENEVRAAVREAIDALACDGTGYLLAPCHNLQAVTPVENIVAMYDEAWRYGVR
jgi:uroporphyrinogen decarboxylase